MDNIDLGMIATFSYCWNKNADSVLPVRTLKSIFSALKALFCGYSIDIASQENQSLIARCGNSLFSCAVLRIQERRTTFITPNTLFSVLNGITRDEKELLADKKEDDNGVHKKNMQCDKPQNNDNFTKSESQKTILVRDVFLSRPPNVTTIDEAKKLLKEELDKQHKDIVELQIDSKYDHTEAIPYSRDYITHKDSRMKEFQTDLDAQYNILLKELEKCGSPEDINNHFKESVLQLQQMGVYRHWCLRQPAPMNPLPHYPGRVSIVNNGTSCGPDAALLQLLHSGTMNYFIFRPIPVEERSEHDIKYDIKSKNDHQKEWKRLHHEILFGSKDGGQIIVPLWIKGCFFHGPKDNDNADEYNGPLFDKNIVFRPQSALRRLNTPGYNTPKKLKKRILSDWRACRLHTGGWHYIALIRDKEGKITSIDGGRVGLRTFKNSQELLAKFMQGEKPYNDPSLIDIWE